MNNLDTRMKTLICNICIVILSIVAIVSYFCLPLWKVDVKFSVNAQVFELMMEGSNEEAPPEGNEFSMENIAKYIGEEEIPIQLSIALDTAYVLSSFQADASSTVQQIIDTNVDNLVEQLYNPLNTILKNAITSVSKDFISTQAKEELKNIYGEGKTDTELDQILTDANINIDEKIDTLVDAIYAEDATVDTISDVIVNTVDDVYTNLKNYDEELFENIAFTEENKETLKTEVSKMLSEIAEEDGSINMDDFISNFIINFLNEENEEESVQPMRLTLAAEETTPDSKEELKNELRNYIMNSIPEGVAEGIVVILQVVGVLILLTFIAWAYLIVKIIIKFTQRNNSIAVKIPIIFGWIPFLFMSILNTTLNALNDPSIFTGEGAAQVVKVMQAASFSISSFSCSFIPFIVAGVLALFSLLYYGKLRNKLKNGEE